MCSLINITSLFRTLIGRPHFGNEGPRNVSLNTRRSFPREWVGRLGTRLMQAQVDYLPTGETWPHCSLPGCRHCTRSDGTQTPSGCGMKLQCVSWVSHGQQRRGAELTAGPTHTRRTATMLFVSLCRLQCRPFGLL